MNEAPKDTDPHADLRRRVEAARKRHGLSLTALKSRMGYSQSAISLWINGTYKGDDDKMAEAMLQWLDGLEAAVGVQLQMGETPDFLETPTSRKFWALLTLAQRAPTMVVITGAPGLGKTMTSRAYAKANRNVWHATMDPTSTSPSQVLLKIARAMGERAGQPNTLSERLGDRMLDAEGLLIVDEAQHCTAKGLEMLRYLHDEYGVGIAFVGNYGLFSATNEPRKRDGFAQFYRRVRKRCWLTQPDAGDVDLILDAYGITDKAERAFLSQIARKNWGLSGITNTIQEARMMAIGAGMAVDIGLLKSAWSGLTHFEGES